MDLGRGLEGELNRQVYASFSGPSRCISSFLANPSGSKQHVLLPRPTDRPTDRPGSQSVSQVHNSPTTMSHLKLSPHQRSRITEGRHRKKRDTEREEKATPKVMRKRKKNKEPEKENRANIWHKFHFVSLSPFLCFPFPESPYRPNQSVLPNTPLAL